MNNNERTILKKIYNLSILKKIFNMISGNKAIDICRGSDYLKNLFFMPQIDIILSDNKFGKFINISGNDKSNFHIYNDIFGREMDENTVTKKDKIKKIIILIDKDINSLKNLFKGCKCIKKIDIISFNISSIKNMSHMFQKCTSLEEINLKNLKTDKVTDMSYMFQECTSIKKLI